MTLTKMPRLAAVLACLGCSLLLVAAVGCAPKEDAAGSSSTSGAQSPQQIDAQIAKIKSDPNMPDFAKQKAIEGLNQAKAMAAANAGGPTTGRPPEAKK